MEQLIRAINKNDTAQAVKITKRIISQQLNKIDINGYTALHWAAEQGMKEVCELLILKMSPEAINAVTIGNVWEGGRTALTLAARS